MKKLLIYYNFIIVSFLVFAGFAGVQSHIQLATSALFYPLFVYFALLVVPNTSKSLKLVKSTPEAEKADPTDLQQVEPLTATRLDADRRSFLKIIGSAGVTVFFYALFSNRAEAAFFGSVPGPGTISLKDISGNKIDPAEKQPTDGYRITEFEDGTPYTYGGYVNKDGAWFISREEVATGSYRYSRGASNFSTNWTNRSSLTYDYFDTIF